MTISPTEPLLQFFGYEHLPPELQKFSRPFHTLAHWIVVELPRNTERTVALRKLLEAKDCAVRAHLHRDAAPLADYERPQPAHVMRGSGHDQHGDPNI